MAWTITGTALAACFCSLTYAQSAADAKPAAVEPEFEVASVKPSVLPGSGGIRLGLRGGPGSGDPGRVTYSFSTLRDLMVEAYSVKRSQIAGVPNWVDSERFDIVAKVPAGATKERVKVMLQKLLAERFKLTLHRETKELPIYALVVSARGPKLKDSAVIDAPVPSAPRGAGMSGTKMGRDGCPETPPRAAGRAAHFVMMTPNGECMISDGQTMDGLAMQLSNRFDRPVIDQTGLKGKYDLRLRYDPSSMPGGRGESVMTKGASTDPTSRSAAEEDSAPSIFNALQEQLGLKLEARKGPVEMLVVDHVEKMSTRN
jgi:uncharacterized protein (TIGR03435 family)